MGQFLNNKEPYDKYKTVMNGTFFVDKTEILKHYSRNSVYSVLPVRDVSEKQLWQI